VPSSCTSLRKAKDELSAAEDLFTEALFKKRAVYGDEHQSTGISIYNLADLLMAKGEVERALPLYEEDLQGLQRRLGNDHPATKTALANVTWLRSDGATAVAQAAKAARKKKLEAKLAQIRTGDDQRKEKLAQALGAIRSGEMPPTVSPDDIKLE
jgi:hypothetical protein